MILKYKEHGEIIIELRGQDLFIYTEAVYPEYFMNIIRQTLEKLIADKWPGMKDKYTFSVPCLGQKNGIACQSCFDIDALSEFLNQGIDSIPCFGCRTQQNIQELLFGFEGDDSREQLLRIESKLDSGFSLISESITGLESRIASYVWTLMQAIADEGKHGPRLYTIRNLGGYSPKRMLKDKYELQLWCEAEGCHHPILDIGKGRYEFDVTREWLGKAAPYLKFSVGLLKTVLPLVSPMVDSYFGSDTIKNLDIEAEIKLTEQFIKTVPKEVVVTKELPRQAFSEIERSSLLALHHLIKEKDPNYEKLGLYRMPTYTGDYRWLCSRHFKDAQSNIPERIE